MENELNKINKYTEKISLNPEEKLSMFKNIRNYALENEIKKSQFYFVPKHTFAYLGLTIFIATTSATSIAAEKSLPGDILYPIKTEINEEIYKSINFGDQKKAKVNVKLIEKRMEEVKELVLENQNNPKNISVISEKLDEHINEIEKIYSDKDLIDSEKAEIKEIYTFVEEITDNQIENLNVLIEEIKVNENTDIKKDETLSDIVLNLQSESSAETESATTTNEITPIEAENIENTITEIIEFSEKIDPIFEDLIQE